MQPSVFTKIINREIPAHIIYEDDDTIAFLDIHGTTPGHTLVVPKRQIDQLWDLPGEEYQRLLSVIKKIALHLREKLGTTRVGVKLMGVDAPHAHIHLIPFTDITEYNNSPSDQVEPDHAALAKQAEQLAMKENE